MAAKYQSSKQTTNFARICRLMVDVIPDLFRDVLTTRLPTSGLSLVLTNQKGQIFSQLNPQQKKILYPHQGGVFQGSVKDLDLSLLYILLRNIGNIPSHQNGWGRVPDAADRSLAANIDRLRVQRNEAYAHAPIASLSDVDFQTRWAIIRQSVEEIQKGALMAGSFVVAVDSILIMTIDLNTEKNFIALLKEIEGEISDVKDRQDVMATDMDNLEGEISDVKDRQDVMATDMDNLEGNVSSVRDDISVVRDDVGAVKDDVGAVRDDVGAVKTDVSAVRDDVSAVRDDVGAVKTDVGAVRDDVGAVRNDVGAVRDDVGTVRDDVDAVRDNVDAVRDDVGAVNERLNVISAARDKDPKLAALIGQTEAMILKEKESFQFVPTKSLQDAREKLLKNRIVIIKGNTGDGKTSIALELLRLLCNGEEEGQQKRCRRPLELHDMKDLDLVKPSSHLVIYLDDIFGTNVVCVPDVKEWEKRKKSVLAILDGKDDREANFLVITIRSGILNSLNDSSLEEIFTEQNIVDLSNYKNADEKLELLRLYKPKDQFISWTDDEEREIVECAPDIGFPQCCRLFRDTPTLHTERVDFFRKPFHFMKSSLSKLEDGKFYALLYLFLNGGKVMEDDLDPYNENIDKKLLEAAFAVDVVKVTRKDKFKTKERKLEFVKESIDCLLGWLVKKESIQKEIFGKYYPCYKFNHDSIEETVALLYGDTTPIGYIQNCPVKSLSYVTTSKTTPNRIVISSNGQTNALYERLVREFKSLYSDPDNESVDSDPDDDWDDRYQPITSLDVWTDTQFLQGFIRELSDQNVDKNLCHQIKLELLNEACSSGAEERALYLLSEGVEPDKETPFCVVEGGSVNLLHKLLEYDVTPTARADRSRSIQLTRDINVLHEACLCEREEMVTVLCDKYPHLVHDTDGLGQSPLHHVAWTGNCGIFHTVERTVRKCLCRVEDEQHKCETVDGRVVHRSCVCAQYMSQLVNEWGWTVLHVSCMCGHRELMLYICESFPALTTVVDKLGCHCLHYIAEWTSDVDLFTECETHVKRYLESTGREYDITAILNNWGRSVLDLARRRRVNNPLYDHLVRLFSKH